MKQFSLKPFPLLYIGVILFASFISRTSVTNFSGKWKLNEGKSDLGEFANFSIRVIEAQQTVDSINIARTGPSFNGTIATTKEQLTFDDKEAESISFGNAKKKSVASWSADGKMLTITYLFQMEFNGTTNEVKGKEIWTLTDEGKTLVVKNSGINSFSQFETTSVYEKQ